MNYPKCRGCQGGDPDSKPLHVCNALGSQRPLLLCEECADSKGLNKVEQLVWPPVPADL